MALTKANIVDSVSHRLGLSKSESVQLVESLLGLIKKALENGEDVLISGFGKFCVKHKSQRRGRNPQTGEGMMLAPRKVVVFGCSGVLRDKINGKEI
ncbi:MAG: integration host factor subunit alpha [Desulfobacterales bacterium]|nr:integration host factor subunit alpha [Desulfobacterales bacterium]